MLKGIAASAGVATAKAYKLEQPVVVIEKSTEQFLQTKLQNLKPPLPKPLRILKV